MTKNKGRKQYSEREKQAYHAGRGYAAGKANKRVKCKTEAEKESFRNGVNAVRGKLKKTTRKSSINCGNAKGYIDADGVWYPYNM